MYRKRMPAGITVCILILGILSGCRNAAAPEPQEEVTAMSTEITENSTEETLAPLPDSLLYYGQILEIRKEEDGTLSQLLMESQRDGRWVMNLGAPTVYIDSGERTAFDPAILQEGDRVYVFRSPISTRSLPPQSPAFAVLRNIPMDASCGMYHEAEAISSQEGDLLITTDNGSRVLKLDPETEVFTYAGEAAGQDEIQPGSHVIAWYWDRGEEVLRTSHLMLLP